MIQSTNLPFTSERAGGLRWQLHFVLILHLSQYSHQLHRVIPEKTEERSAHGCPDEDVDLFFLLESGRQSADIAVETEFAFQFCEHVCHWLVFFLYLSCPSQIRDSVLVAAKDMTVLIDPLIHLADVLDHFSGIAFEESPNPANEKRIARESA